MIQARYYILSLLGVLTFLITGCSDYTPVEEVEEESRYGLVQVALDLSVPMLSTPTISRGVSITDDSAISEYVLWIFRGQGDEATLLEQISSTDKDEAGDLRTVIRNGHTLYTLLPESDDPVTVVMLANVNLQNIKVEPGTIKSEALAKIEYDVTQEMTSMPMYGEYTFLSTSLGSTGAIKLKRAMAKITINAQPAFDHFQITGIQVVHANSIGKVCSGEKKTEDYNGIEKTQSASISEENNEIFCYVPELTNVEERGISVIVKGNYRNQSNRYYKLDFIGKTSLKYIEEIKRNYNYTFIIDHMTDKGYDSLEEAIENPASNGVPGTPGVIEIEDEGIMDITTDRFYYFGVTSKEVTVYSNDNYYFLEFYAKGDHPDGWYTMEEELNAKGISVVPAHFQPGDEDFVIGVSKHIWVYIDKKQVTSGQVIELYIYSGKIRKVINVKIP